ncbi:MAG: hypothetical protein K0R64_1179 [Novosphingobium lindaniclasticum]|jgi:hypothetical protein|nr:hypothetical protein [Novosphingobium lindaniclasticum]
MLSSAGTLWIAALLAMMVMESGKRRTALNAGPGWEAGDAERI